MVPRSGRSRSSQPKGNNGAGGVLTAKGSKTFMKKLKEHDELFWHFLDGGHSSPCELVNIDAHSDMSMYNGHLDIGNFISQMAYMQMVDKVTWIREVNSLDFVDGEYNFEIGRRGDSLALGSTLQAPFCFFNEDYSLLGNLQEPKEFFMSVITDVTAKTRPVRPKPWALSIDCDYFSCLNPHVKDLEEIVRMIGHETVATLYAMGNSRQTIEEWNQFRSSVEKMAPGMFNSVARCILPGFACTEDQIEEKVINLKEFIEKTYDPSQCVGAYLVESLSSGFMDPTRYEFVVERITKQFSEYK